MPIVNEDDSAPSTQQPVVVRIAEPEFKGVVVDTRYEPTSNLLTHVQGSSWTVNYYSQVLDADNTVQGQNPTLDPVYQQYRLIRGMELKVTSPLATSQDTTTTVMTLQGAANVYPFLVPNVGDMFLADIGDGNEGVFKVTRSTRKSIFKDTCYEIEYAQTAFADADRVGDLNSKVVQTLQYVRDFLEHGQNPLLVLEDFEIARELVDRYHDLTEQYFQAYTSYEYRTITAPQQAAPTYDHFLMKALVRHFSTWDASPVRHLKVMNVEEDNAMKCYSVWDALSERNPRRLRNAFRQAGLTSAKLFDYNPMMEGIYWSGLSDIVYPKDAQVTVNFEYSQPQKSLLSRTLTTVGCDPAALPALLDPAVLASLPYGPSTLLINPANQGGYYVFSQAFYDQASVGQSSLELAVHDYLDGKTINNRLLLALCDTFHAWGSLERYYYLPVLLLLIKASIRSL